MRVLNKVNCINDGDVDLRSCLFLDNINDEMDIKMPELEMRLLGFGIQPEAIRQVVSFCRQIGAELKAIEDNSNVDYMVGLGGFGLGLTTTVAARPSKGLLPLLRLGGSIPAPRSGRIIQWKPLLPHRNTSGAG
jgi:hypothetical protein